MLSMSAEERRNATVIVLTFAGGFIAAHLLIRWSSREASDSRRGAAVQAGSSRVIQKQVSDSSTQAPHTPLANDVKPHVTFDVAGEAKASSGFPCQVSVFSAHSVQQPQPPARGPLLGEHVEPPIERTYTGPLGIVPPDMDDSPQELPPPALARAPSLIPSDINVPELVFGYQYPNGNRRERLPVIPFSTYAPCRLLDVDPNLPGTDRGSVFEGIRTIAAFYLRADSSAICECIQNFGLNDLLFSVARLELSFKKTLRVGLGGQREAMISQAAEKVMTPDGVLGPKGAEEAEAVRSVVAALMHELECILHEYLSYNWDRASQIYDANKKLLQSGMLNNMYKSAPILSQSQPETPTCGSSPSAVSRNASNLAELMEADSPPSTLSGGGGMTQSSSRTSLADMVRKRLEDDSGAESSTMTSPSSSLEAASPSLRDSTRRGGSAADGPGESSSDDEEVEEVGERVVRMSRRRSRGAVDGGSPRMSPRSPADTARRPSHRRAVRNWKRAKAAAQRKVTKEMLGPKRRFMTLQEMFEDMNRAKEEPGRQPIILLLGGGMAAGKSTVREIIGKDGFWSKVGKDAVIVEADAIKNMEGLFRELSRMDMKDMLDRLDSGGDSDADRHMHDYSTKAAENQLVAAVNQQRDVVFDGTMTWAPFVQQTIAMVRDHRHNYKRGPGNYVDDDGNVHERYWEIDESSPIDVRQKQAYRIELVGVTCDTGLAVARGIWRKIRTGRSVPVHSQLRSHRLFAENFEDFANAVDSATLYHTGSALTTFNKGGVDLSPTVIAHRSSYTRGELLINPKEYESFKHKVHIIDRASSRHDLYESAGCVCKGKVPTTQEDQMSTLRHVFRAAHRKQQKSSTKTPPIPRATSFW